MSKYFIKTYGCQMNIADSERIAASLEAQGYSRAQETANADLVVINTCSVRQASEDKVYGFAPRVLKLKIENCKLKIILTGCMVGSVIGKRRRIKLSELKRKMPWVDEFRNIEELVGDAKAVGKIREPALVPVMRGCDQFCTYCVVPYGRGLVRSRPMEEIVEEIKCLIDRGVKRIMLLGQSINDYGQDLDQTRVILRRQPKNPSRMRDYLRQAQRFFPFATLRVRMTTMHPFVELLRGIHGVEGLEKISLLSFNPWNFPSELIEVLAMPKFERYTHLPVQSGDDEILKKMNRPYTVAEYKELIKKIRKKIPRIRIGTDVIVGFPGETKEQFQKTVDLFRELKFDVAYIAMYSKRPGTAAAKVYKDNVPLAEKKRRHKVLMQVWRESKN